MVDAAEFEVAAVDYSRETFEKELEDGHVLRQDEPVIHATGYDEEGEHHHAKIRGFEPYFYVPYEEAGTVERPGIVRYELYDESGEEFQSVRRERLARVVCTTPKAVRECREAFEERWEADVHYPTRFIVDHNVTSGLRVPAGEEYVDVADVETCEVYADWRVHVMDIEVDDRNGFPQDGEEEILCITAYDSYDDEYITWLQGEGEHEEYAAESELHGSDVDVRWFDDEVIMLRSYLAYLSASKPSILTGWNVDDFDMPYLHERLEVLDEECDLDLTLEAASPMWDVRYHDYYGVDVSGMAVLDLMQTYERRQRTEKESYRLDAVAEDEIGTSKEEFVGKIGKLWEDDPVKLVDYNLRDVELCVELDRRQSLIAFAKEIKRFVGCQLEDSIIESTVSDRYILNLCHGEVVLPETHAQEGEEFSGATVFEAADGLHEWIATLDLKSLYPMSMLSINASPETKVDPDEYEGETRQSPNGIHFRTDRDGITREVIETLLEKRVEKKEQRDEHDPGDEEYEVYDLQQRAVKVIMNALYGMMGWTKFRLYDVDVASAVTATGREVIEYTGEVAQDYGWDVKYGDTDSVLLDAADSGEAKEEIIEACKEIEAQINEAYDEFAAERLDAATHRFQIEFEKLYRRYFQAGKKKRYAGHSVWDEGKDVDSLSITGFDYKRSNTAQFTKRVQYEVLDMIVRGEPVEDVAAYVREQHRKLEERRVALEDLGIPQGVGEPMHSYDQDTHAVRSAKTGNLTLGLAFAQGSKPKRYYVEEAHPAFFEELEAEHFDSDRDAMYREFKQDCQHSDDFVVLGVERVEQLPSEVVLDWDETLRKTLRLPIRPIMESLDVPWDDIENESSQAGLAAFG